MMRMIAFQIMIASAGYDLHAFEKRDRISRIEDAMANPGTVI